MGSPPLSGEVGRGHSRIVAFSAQPEFLSPPSPAVGEGDRG